MLIPGAGASGTPAPIFQGRFFSLVCFLEKIKPTHASSFKNAQRRFISREETDDSQKHAAEPTPESKCFGSPHTFCSGNFAARDLTCVHL